MEMSILREVIKIFRNDPTINAKKISRNLSLLRKLIIKEMEWKFPFIFFLSSLMASPSTETGGGRWSRLWSVTARQREDTPASEMSTRYSHVRSDV